LNPPLACGQRSITSVKFRQAVPAVLVAKMAMGWVPA
jgi:hypothetical protein